MPRIHKSHAFSVVEMMVALSLMGFLLAGIYGLLTLGMRHAREADVFETVHSQALIALAKMRQEVTLTSYASLNDLSTAPDHLIFASPQRTLDTSNHQVFTYDGTGNLEWHKWVCFFRDPTENTVVRVELPLSPATNAPPTNPPPLADFTVATGKDRRTIARNCSALSFENGTAVLGSVRMTVETSKLVNSEDRTMLRLIDDVKPRNEP
ncbi:MAG: type II secretion system protein [Candidatus Eremiobacteraeota bacterium]|nr:type II secretion system protein [Candidatus Eremiobacteraeota bacterium]